MTQGARRQVTELAAAYTMIKRKMYQTQVVCVLITAQSPMVPRPMGLGSCCAGIRRKRGGNSRATRQRRALA